MSQCGRYRYRLDRQIGMVGPVYAFFGINPSTADAEVDDATVRKWIGFSKRWGASRFIVGNVFAYRARDVSKLAGLADPHGPENNKYLEQIIAEADVLVPCWGAVTKVPEPLRLSFEQVMGTLAMSNKPVQHLGLTKAGNPRHPLMLSYKTPLQDWKR